MRYLSWIILVLAFAAGGYCAGVSDDRVLKVIDFEERHLGNAEEVPFNWTKVQGAGYPHYVSGQMSSDRAKSGKYSFRYDLNGGSLVYRYNPGQVQVSAGAHYRVEAFVQTTVLKHARARVTAYYVDSEKFPIASSIRHSDLYASTREDEGWKPLAIELSAPSDATSLVVELELLQPEKYAAATLGQQTLFSQDIKGSAWFEDLTISQIPKVTITTDRPGNLFKKGEEPSLAVTINDRNMNDLAAQLLVKDAKGETAYQRSGSIDISSGKQIDEGTRKMYIPLPGLKPGWYEASMSITSRGRVIATQVTDVILLADDGGGKPDPRFGVDATGLPFEFWDQLPDLLPQIGVGRVKLAVWSENADIQQTDAMSFDELLVKLGERNVTPTACLVDIPPSIAAKIGGKSWKRFVEASPEIWRPQLAFMISRHANHLDRWQLGVDGSDLFVTDPSMREAYALIYKEFSKLMQKPDLAMPWPAWHEMQGDMPATVALSIPPAVMPSQIPLYMQDIKKAEGHNLSLSMQMLDESKYGRDVMIRDLAQRTLYALAAGATRIDFPLPLAVKRLDDGQRVHKPQEMLMIIRTLATTLSGAQFMGRVPIAEGVEAFLFDRNGQSIVALWDKGTTGGNRKLALTLGESPRAVDLWGNVTPLIRPMENGQPSQAVNLTLGPMPIFLVDIDGPLAQLRASLSIDQPLVESSFRAHTRKIRFTNPYKTAISGSLRLKPPEGWTIKPPVINFNVNPNELFEREITIEFPFNSNAGAKTVQAEFVLQDNKISSTTAPLILHLGLSEVGMQSMAFREGKDVMIQQVVTNYGEKSIDYTAFAIFPGQPREERMIVSLRAGQSSIKLYRFPAKEGAVKVRIGVKETAGSRILNDEIEIP